MTRSELAEAAGISRLTLRRIEADDGYAPTGSVQLRLAHVLEVDVQALFWSEPVRTNSTEPIAGAAV